MTAVVTDLNIMSKKISMLKLSGEKTKSKSEKVMNEIKVDWSLAPEDATELVKVCVGGQRWRNAEKLQYWELNGDFAGYYSKNSPLDEAKVLATRPQQTKTVADAVEWNEKVFKSKEWKNDKCGYIVLYANSFSYSSSKNSGDLVCTREQYEAYVKEKEAKKEGEKWTHTCDGNECKLLADKHDLFNRMPVQYKSGEYGLVHISDLKPIKPKLTKEQSEALIKFSSEVGSLEITAEVESYLKKYS